MRKIVAAAGIVLLAGLVALIWGWRLPEMMSVEVLPTLARLESAAVSTPVLALQPSPADQPEEPEALQSDSVALLAIAEPTTLAADETPTGPIIPDSPIIIESASESPDIVLILPSGNLPTPTPTLSVPPMTQSNRATEPSAPGPDAAELSGIFAVSCGNSADLISKINLAQNESLNPGPDILDLGGPECVYTLTSRNNSTSLGSNGLPRITTDLTLRGTGAIIERDSALTFRFFYVQSSGRLSLENLTLRSGDPGNAAGGAIYNRSGEIILQGVTLEGNQANQGGAIYNYERSSASLSASSLIGNSATLSGGALYNNGIDAAMTLDASSLLSNTAPIGGAIYNVGRGQLIVRNGSTIGTETSPNTASNSLSGGGGVFNIGAFTHFQLLDSSLSWNSAGNGAGLYNTGSAEATLINSELAHNSATGAAGGGAIFNIGSGSKVTLNASTLHSSTAVNGAALYNTGGAVLDILNGTLIGGAGQGNIAIIDGGGIFNTGGGTQLYMNTSQIIANQSGQGAAIANTGGALAFIANNSQLSANQALYEGGAILNIGQGSQLSLIGSQLIGNTAAKGAAVYNTGAATATLSGGSLIGTALAPNIALEGGGAIFNTGIGSSLSLLSITVGHNQAVDGAALYNTGGATATLSMSNLTDHVATGNGGAIFNSGSGSSLTLSANSILRNQANRGAGLYNTGEGQLIIQADNLIGSVGNGNISTLEGGAIHNSGSGTRLTMLNSALGGNSATTGAGLFNTGAAIADISGSLISANEASGDGGGISNNSSGTRLTLLLTELSANEANRGGGLYNGGDGLTQILDSAINGNSATTFGGGIHNASFGAILTLDNSAVNGNQALDGAGIANVGGAAMTILDSRVGSALAPNSATADGGGIHNGDLGSSVNLMRSAVAYNMADKGAGLFNNDGRFFAEASTLAYNSATDEGGGLYSYRGELSLTNSTLSNNSAATGGAVFVDEYGNDAAALIHSTLGFNSAGLGGGIHAVDSAVRLFATLIEPGSGASCSGDTIISLGYNLSGDASCSTAFSALGDQVGASLLLDPLADNGGPTETHTFDPFSPVAGSIPAADCDIVSIDQRGVPRPQGLDCESGALEFIEPFPLYGSTPLPGAMLRIETPAGLPGTTSFIIREIGTDDLVIESLLLEGDPEITLDALVTPFTIINDANAPRTIGLSCESATPDRVLRCSLAVVHNAPGSPARYSVECRIGGLPRDPRVQTVGVYRDGVWLLNERNASSVPDQTFQFGPPAAGWTALAGDWDGDGTQTAGLYRNGVWLLRFGTQGGAIDLSFQFGPREAGWLPIVGDWNGDGIDTIGLYRNGEFRLRNSNSTGEADKFLRFGPMEAGWLPIAGDWNGDFLDTVGLYRNGLFQMRNSNTSGPPDLQFYFGAQEAGWLPVAGDWNENGRDSIGVYRAGVWRLRNTNNAGPADLGFNYGPLQSGWQPVIGQYAELAMMSMLGLDWSMAVEDLPTEEAPTEEAPTEAPPTEAPPTEASSTEEAPTEALPTEAPPTEEPPTEAPPTEEPPAEASSTGG